MVERAHGNHQNHNPVTPRSRNLPQLRRVAAFSSLPKCSSSSLQQGQGIILPMWVDILSAHKRGTNSTSRTKNPGRNPGEERQRQGPFRTDNHWARTPADMSRRGPVATIHALGRLPALPFIIQVILSKSPHFLSVWKRERLLAQSQVSRRVRHDSRRKG